jgi:hypothetical protein
MADVKIDLRARLLGERELNKAKRKLTEIGLAAAAADAKLRTMGNSSDGMAKSLDKAANRFRRHFDDLDKMVVGFGKMLTGVMKFAAKAFTLEMVAMGASMLAVHALFVAGRGLMKAYHASLQVVAGGAAAAAVSIAAVAAALREQQAAMFAFKAKDLGYKEIGTSTSQVSAAMRALHSDAMLASAGVENLNTVFAAVSQNSTFTAGTQKLLKGLMDFASAGQPLEQGMKAAGEFLAALQDKDSSFATIKQAAEAMGPQMKKAMEEAGKKGIDTVDELKKAINSGQLAVLGGVEGQFDAVNDTLLNRFKKQFTILRTDFADLGDSFLEPLKNSLEEIGIIVRRTFLRVRGQLGEFGGGTFLDSLIGLAEKLENAFVRLMRDYLPKAMGMFDRIGNWWDRFTNGWDRLIVGLRPLIKGAEVIEAAFGNLFDVLGESFSNKFGSFNKQLQDNRVEFELFGTRLGEVLSAFGDFTNKLRELFFQGLPFINNALKGIKEALGYLTDTLGLLQKTFGGMGGGGGAFMTLVAAMIGLSKLRGHQGGFIRNMQLGTVQMQAQNVTVTGITAGGQALTGAVPPQGGYYRGGGGRGGNPSAVGFPSSTGATVPNMLPLRGGFASSTPAGPSSPIQLGSNMYHGVNVGTRDIDKIFASSATPRELRNNLVAAGLSRQQVNTLMSRVPFTPQGPQTMMGRMGMGLRARRTSARYGGLMRANQSMTGRMGSAMGMSLLAGMMPEEAQGSMALGAMVSSFNPLLGAAVGLGGTAMNAQSAGGGAMTGAGAGAALGTMIAPGIGTVVGGIIGGVGGAIIGGINAEKVKIEKAEKAAEDIFSGIADSFTDSFKEIRAVEGYLSNQAIQRSFDTTIGSFTQGISSARSQMGDEQVIRAMFRDPRSFGLPDDLLANMDIEDALGNTGAFFSGLADTSSTYGNASNLVLQNRIQQTEGLARALNKTDEEILRLADDLGINLADETINLQDAIRSLTGAMIDSAADMQGAMADMMGNQFTLLQRYEKAAEAPELLDQLGRTFRERAEAGDLSEGDVFAFLSDNLGALTDLYGGDAFRASEAFNSLFVQGSAFTQAGGYLEGQQGIFNSPAVQEFLAGFAQEYESTRIATQQEGLTNMLANAGFSINAAGAQAFGNLDLATFDKVTSYLTDTDFEGKTEQQVVDELTRLMDVAGIGISAIPDQIDTINKNTTALNTLSGDLYDFTQQLMASLDPANTASTGDDTRTPRFGDTSSAMAQTLSRHNQIDSMVGGKRSITSGYRNFALGSMNSDHVNGRALDLVGQNLVGYKDAVNSSGGFAEFHGGGKSRHLHAVPGPIGDTSSPVSGGGGGTVINVYPGQNADANEVANLVMMKMQSAERSRRERM